MRFYTFRPERDLEILKTTGIYTETDNLNDNYLFNVIAEYTGKKGIVWFWATEDEMLNEYLDYDYRLEFKQPKEYILLTPERFEYLSKGIIDEYSELLEDTTNPEEGYSKLFKCTNIRSYIDDFEPCTNDPKGFNPIGLSQGKSIYMGLMTYLDYNDIISIDKISPNTEEINKANF